MDLSAHSVHLNFGLTGQLGLVFVIYIIYIAQISSLLVLTNGALDLPHFYISCTEIDVALCAAGQEVFTHSDIICNDTPMAPSSLVHEVLSIINTHSSAPNVSIPTLLDPVVPPAQGAEMNGETQAQGKHYDDYSTFIRNNMDLWDILHQ